MAWSAWAEKAHGLLGDRFWDRRRGLFRVSSRRRLCARRRWHYWWQAHALDALVDAAAREGSGSAVARDRIATLVAGILRRNGGRIVNDYYDDMAWMALALHRAEESAGVQTGGLVRILWEEIQTGWDERHHGFIWRRGDTYTNTPANAPSALLAARLYARHRDPADLQWANTINDWLHATLVDADTGLVWDGIHPEIDPHPSRELYTYNQGTVVGAAVELYRLTRRAEHLTRAAGTVRATLGRLVRPTDGMLVAEGTGDGGLFKGILVRYLGEFVLAASSPDGSASSGPDSPGGAATQVVEMLRDNGTAIAAAAGNGPVGPDWAIPAGDAGSLSTQLSAVMLVETLARLEAAGVPAVRPAAPP